MPLSPSVASTMSWHSVSSSNSATSEKRILSTLHFLPAQRLSGSTGHPCPSSVLIDAFMPMRLGFAPFSMSRQLAIKSAPLQQIRRCCRVQGRASPYHLQNGTARRWLQTTSTERPDYLPFAYTWLTKTPEQIVSALAPLLGAAG